MLARIKAKEIGRIGGRLAAVLAGSQFTVAAARVGDHAKLAGDCAGDSAFHLAAALGQTAWSMLDACLVGQVVHGAGAYLMSGSATARSRRSPALSDTKSLAIPCPSCFRSSRKCGACGCI